MEMDTSISRLSIFTMVLLIFLFSCRDWEKNVVRMGVHFDKISQSKNGTITGYMSQNNVIKGFPCEKGWIHFREDENLLAFQLSEKFTYKGTEFPAHTWIHLPYHEGKTDYVVSLPDDRKIQGHLCDGSGGYKGTHTGFYENGRLRSFFAPEDVIIAGIPCESSLLVNIELYKNGNLKKCKLADDCEIHGRKYKKGTVLAFDQFGQVK